MGDLSLSTMANIAEIIGAGSIITGLIFGWFQIRHLNGLVNGQRKRNMQIILRTLSTAMHLIDRVRSEKLLLAIRSQPAGSKRLLRTAEFAVV